MNKLIQSIALTAVVFSPLSLISSASAHHTGSHLSTIAAERKPCTKKASTPIKKSVTTASQSMIDSSVKPAIIIR